jgi:Flp pilus assembly protein TadB
MALGARRGDGVALSDDEQRVLAEIEQGLFAEDPGFAESTGRRRMGFRWAVWVVGMCIGFGCVVLGLVIAGGVGVAVAVFGLVVIVVCAATVRSRRRRRPRRPPDMAV